MIDIHKLEEAAELIETELGRITFKSDPDLFFELDRAAEHLSQAIEFLVNEEEE